MSGVLVVAEHLQGQLRDVTRELVTAAGELGGPVTVAVIAHDPAPLAEAANLAGVDEVVMVRVGSEEFEVDSSQAALEALLTERRPEVTLLGFTVNSMGFGPAVAAKLGSGFASDVFGIAREGESVVANAGVLRLQGAGRARVSPGRASDPSAASDHVATGGRTRPGDRH